LSGLCGGGDAGAGDTHADSDLSVHHWTYHVIDDVADAVDALVFAFGCYFDPVVVQV